MADDDVVEALKTLSTPVVSDALDRLGIDGQASGIARITGQGTVVGRAWTLQYTPIGTEGGTVGDYIDDAVAGSIIVLANNVRTDVTIWGGLLSEVASYRGVVATVMDGTCRDTPRAVEVGYSLFARSHWMRTGKDRVRVESTQKPVSIGGILVRPEDVLVGDADGVVVVPRERAEEIVKVALKIEEAEQAIHNEAMQGVRLDEARRRHGYHNLQTKTD
jgi:regulator of RNase E activity RraA